MNDGVFHHVLITFIMRITGSDNLSEAGLQSDRTIDPNDGGSPDLNFGLFAHPQMTILP
jgi:hypothetical protein